MFSTGTAGAEPGVLTLAECERKIEKYNELMGSDGLAADKLQRYTERRTHYTAQRDSILEARPSSGVCWPLPGTVGVGWMHFHGMPCPTSTRRSRRAKPRGDKTRV